MLGHFVNYIKLMTNTLISIECRIFPFTKTRIFLNCNLLGKLGLPFFLQNLL